MEIKIVYHGFDRALDEILTTALVGAGLVWHEQRYDWRTKKRVIVLSYGDEEEKKI